MYYYLLLFTVLFAVFIIYCIIIYFIVDYLVNHRCNIENVHNLLLYRTLNKMQFSYSVRTIACKPSCRGGPECVIEHDVIAQSLNCIGSSCVDVLYLQVVGPKADL